MKKYILMLITTVSSLTALAQNSQIKSEKISFSAHETNTEHSLKASFPTQRADRVHIAFESVLGNAQKSSPKESTWTAANYTATVTTTGFRANLDKEKASAEEIQRFKQLAASLHKALGQPKPPVH